MQMGRVSMSELIKQACEHWRYVAPLLSKPTNEDDYDALVEALDELLALVGDDEDHPLAGLASRVGDMIEAYDKLRRSLTKAGGVEVLGYLMQEQGLGQWELPEVASQSVISEVLSGNSQLNVHHNRAL